MIVKLTKITEKGKVEHLDYVYYCKKHTFYSPKEDKCPFGGEKLKKKKLLGGV